MNNLFKDIAPQYFEKGLPVIPVRGKIPMVKEWSKYSYSQANSKTINEWLVKYSSAGIGLVCGPLSQISAFDLDLDFKDPRHLEIYETIKHLIPDSPVEITGKKGFKRLFRHQPGHLSKAIRFGNLNVIDFLSTGRQFVLPPSPHSDENFKYEFSKGNLLDHIGDLPEFDPKRIYEIQAILNVQFKSQIRLTNGRNNILKDQAAAAIIKGKSIQEIAKELLKYDQKNHKPPLFSDSNEPQMRNNSPIRNAIVFVENIRKSIGDIHSQESVQYFEGLFKMSDVEAEEIEWLWHPYIPKRKLTMLEGDPGIGKSYITLSLAADISRGTENIPPDNVLLLLTEDGVRDTIKNRLNKFECDQSRIHVYNESFEFNEAGIKKLIALINKTGSKLVVIDPVVAYASTIDMHRANEVRAVMSKLAHIAETYDCTFLIVRHLSKGGTDKAIYRGQGSVDFTAAARSVMLVGVNSKNSNERGVVHIKSNLAPFGKSLGFKIDDGKFNWTGESNLTSQDILGSEFNKTNKFDAAEEFLKNILEAGPVSQTEIIDAAKVRDISERTINRAKKSLNIVSTQSHYTGKQGGGEWYWSLPKDQD